ncbi:class I SAM-dependent methyltransferase [Chloroflexota bacterium]
MLNEIQETPYGIKKRLQFIYREITKSLNNVEDKSKIRVLDIGCGTGDLITIPLGSLGVTVLGIDTHLSSIEHARKKNPFKNVQFEHMPIEGLADQQFDFIICSEVLEHLSEPIIMLKLIKGFLEYDGICIITIPNGYSLKEIEVRIYKAISSLGLASLLRYLGKPVKKVERPFGLKDTLSKESPHIQSFPMGRFKSLLEKCELSIVKRENRRFLDGFLVNRIFSTSKVLTNWNVSVANKIPYPLASSWMFLVEHKR